MKQRSFSIVLGVVLVLSLAGCSLEGRLVPDTLSTPAVEPERPAFHFDSGTLELGDFNHEEIKDDLFSPCEEISAEEFAAIGFKTVGGTRRLAEVNGLGCGLISSEEEVVYAIAASAEREDELKTSGILGEDVSAVIPGTFLYRGKIPQEHACVAAVITRRGQLSVAAREAFDELETEALCDTALDLMEKLYEL